MIIPRFVQPVNYDGLFRVTPVLAIIHATGSPNVESVYAEFNDPKVKNSAHFVIDRNGDIYHMVPLDRVAYHAGVSSFSLVPESKYYRSCNFYSFGIELVNIGPLTELDIDDNRYLTYYGREYKPAEVVFQDGKYWEPYTPEQYIALNTTIDYIETVIGKQLKHITGHADVALPNGRKVDPYCIFDWKQVMYGKS